MIDLPLTIKRLPLSLVILGLLANPSSIQRRLSRLWPPLWSSKDNLGYFEKSRKLAFWTFFLCSFLGELMRHSLAPATCAQAPDTLQIRPAITNFRLDPWFLEVKNSTSIQNFQKIRPKSFFENLDFMQGESSEAGIVKIKSSVCILAWLNCGENRFGG